jgi:hypothetical protein
MTQETSASNENATDVEQGNSTNDTKVNPGAIRKSTTSSILNALSQASGEQFESVEAALAFVARTSSTKTATKTTVTETSDDHDSVDSDSDLKEQFQRLRKELGQKDRALKQKELDSEIIQNMGDRFDPDLVDYALQKVKSNFKVKSDGTYVIVNNKGQERYGQDGNPLSIKGLIDEVAQGNPKLLKGASQSSGSGLRPGQTRFAGANLDAVPDYSKDPAAFNAWAKNNGLGRGVGLKGTKVTASSSANIRKIL